MTQDEQDIALIVPLLKAGYGWTQVARKLEIHQSRMERLLRLARMPKQSARPERRTLRKIHEIEIEHGMKFEAIIEDARRRKLGYVHLGAEIGLNPDYISRFCARRGIRPLARPTHCYYRPTPDEHAYAVQRAIETTQKMVTWNGETLPMKDWADRMGVKRDTLQRRLARMPLERAMTKPAVRRKAVADKRLDGKVAER